VLTIFHFTANRLCTATNSVAELELNELRGEWVQKPFSCTGRGYTSHVGKQLLS
jgi:hypothetical protein